MRFAPIAGYEFRGPVNTAHAADFGILSEGGMGAVSYRLDARMFVEHYDDLYHESYDREFVERQDEEASGSVAYSSFSRYRSDLSYDASWGRLTIARDAVHWGPGQFSNLVFQQDAVPFNQLTLTSRLGPFSVQSLYGQLAASRDWEHDTSSQSKSLYAHRYEWRIAPDLLLGISEQLILYEVSAPFAFVPVVPLFIAKASEKERLNNGNIAFDLAYRIRGLGRVYTEFLIDDVQSPASLFNDDWGNKWGWMGGAHLILDRAGVQSGLIAEYSRVEPWVYTHYTPHTAQTANFDYPLGNPWGPNSQAMTVKAYAGVGNRWYLAMRAQLVWKGTAPGSDIEDVYSRNTLGGTKEFLGEGGSPRPRVSPFAWMQIGRTAFRLQADLFGGTKLIAGLQWRY